MGNPVQEGYDTTKPLTLDLDLENIVAGIKNWEYVVYAVERGVDKGIEELGYKLRLKMVEYLNMYGLGDSTIARNIMVTPFTDGLSIMVGSEYAVYVEFGTGQVGKDNPHPRPWAYDVNGHREGGWWYPTTNSDPNPTKKIGSDGQMYAWTKGQKSKPFMYMTWLWGTRSATQIIRKNIRNEVKKVKGVR